MFGNNKKKNAELLAPIWLADMKKARDVVNNTTDPDSFFTDYANLKDLAEKLTALSKYVHFKGTKPAEVLKMAQKQEDAATRDFILRYFQKTLQGTEKVKTIKGKRSQFERFQTSLEPYYYQMSAANIDLVQQLHDEAIVKIGG